MKEYLSRLSGSCFRLSFRGRLWLFLPALLFGTIGVDQATGGEHDSDPHSGCPHGGHDKMVCELYPIALSTQTLQHVAVGSAISNILNGAHAGNLGWLTGREVRACRH